MMTVFINRRRLLVGDRFVLPGDANRVLYTVTGRDDKLGLVIRRKGDFWYGYLNAETGVVTGSRFYKPSEELVTITDAVLMRECDIR